MKMNKQKAANLIDKLIQCKYLCDVDKCPNVPCRDCEYSTEHYDTREIIEAMKMALEALEANENMIPMSKWIRCSERKPEIGKRVLVASYTGLIKDKPFIRIGVFDDYHTGEVLCFTENGYVMPTQPLLWKYLPVAPSWDAVKE